MRFGLCGCGADGGDASGYPGAEIPLSDAAEETGRLGTGASGEDGRSASSEPSRCDLAGTFDSALTAYLDLEGCYGADYVVSPASLRAA